jgi:hypothetical protein
VKAPELKCTYHQGVICMTNGTLHLQQAVIPGTKEYTDAVEVWGPEAGEGANAFRTEVGHFCTIHALYSWCKAQGAMEAQRNAMEAKRRPPPANPEARPTVAQRRSRPSLMGRTQ